MEELNIKNVNVEKIYVKKGDFTTPEGQNFKYKNAYIEFTIGEYPLIFKAKMEKPLVDYLEQAYENSGE